MEPEADAAGLETPDAADADQNWARLEGTREAASRRVVVVVVEKCMVVAFSWVFLTRFISCGDGPPGLMSGWGG